LLTQDIPASTADATSLDAGHWLLVSRDRRDTEVNVDAITDEVAVYDDGEHVLVVAVLAYVVDPSPVEGRGAR
jgi:hypothetical protein